jgi:hypothetical protein
VPLHSSEAQELRDFVQERRSASPNEPLFEVKNSASAFGNTNHAFRITSDRVVPSLKKIVDQLLGHEDNLQKLRDFNYGSSHEFYPSDVMVGLDSDDEGTTIVSISSRNSTFSR